VWVEFFEAEFVKNNAHPGVCYARRALKLFIRLVRLQNSLFYFQRILKISESGAEIAHFHFYVADIGRSYADSMLQL
jgi:hypothetical protein